MVALDLPIRMAETAVRAEAEEVLAVQGMEALERQVKVIMAEISIVVIILPVAVGARGLSAAMEQIMLAETVGLDWLILFQGLLIIMQAVAVGE